MDRQEKLAVVDVKNLLIEFSVPAIIAMLVNALYNVVDRIFIGNIKDIGEYAITGIGLTFPIMTVIMAFGMLVGIGAAATISLKLGEQKKQEAENILGNAFVLIIIIAIMITIGGLILAPKVLLLFNVEDIIYGYAVDYITIILYGTIFNTLSFGLNHCIRGEGNPRRAASTMLIGALINFILDPILIFVFHLGVEGAAIATIISQFVSAVWVLSYFITGKSSLKLQLLYFKLKKKVVLTIFAIGVSPFSMQLAASIVMIIVNKSLKIYGGDLAIGAMTIINSVSMMVLMPIFGINQGAQPIIGYNYGAKSFKRVKDTFKLAIAAATAIVVVGFLIIELFPQTIINIFNNNEQLVSITVHGIRIYLMMLPVVGFQIVSSNYFQSIGKAKIAIFLSLLRQVIILIPMYIILPKIWGLGLDGIWIAGPVADFIASFITGIFLYRELKHFRQYEFDNEDSELQMSINKQ